VAVQTARPEHEAIAAAVAQDHPGFAESELRFRRAFSYPPFSHLLLALWTAKEQPEALAAARTGRASNGSRGFASWARRPPRSSA
jgi:primosomal protein N'